MRRHSVRLVLLVLALASPWLSTIPAASFRGVAVLETCDRALQERYQDKDVYRAAGGTRFDWWLPGWDCRAADGRSARLWPTGGA